MKASLLFVLPTISIEHEQCKIQVLHMFKLWELLLKVAIF